jgi:hypothetical protein
MDSLYNETVAAGVGMYLVLFALLVFGGIAIYVGYRALGGALLAGVVALLVALAAGAFG